MKSVWFDKKEIFPSKIVCVGRNYVDHIRELDNEIPEEPVIFIKPNSSLSKTLYAGREDDVHYEGEITFLILSGKIAGVGFGLDLTKRAVQSRLKEKGLPWERSKAFDGSAVFSDFVSFNGRTNDLKMELYKNGTRIQEGGCSLMINRPESLLKDAGRFLTFEDGDLLMTGTPKGVGPVLQGDRFEGTLFEKDSLLIKASWTAE